AAAFCQSNGASVSAGTGGSWVGQAFTADWIEYLLVASNTALTATFTASNAAWTAAIGFWYTIAAPSQAAAAGFSALSFNDEFAGIIDIGYGTDGHKWSANQWYQALMPSSCVSQSGSVMTMTSKMPVTTTTATFSIPAANTAVAVSISAFTLYAGDVLMISDGTHTLACDVTIVTSSTAITVNPRAYPGNNTSGTMGNAAVVNLLADASVGVAQICTQQQDLMGGTYFLEGYFEAYMLGVDWAAFWLYQAPRPMGIVPTSGNPFTQLNEIDIIETDPAYPGNVNCTLHSNTGSSGGITDQFNSPNAQAV